MGKGKRGTTHEIVKRWSKETKISGAKSRRG